jgi:hypothetical protein
MSSGGAAAAHCASVGDHEPSWIVVLFGFSLDGDPGDRVMVSGPFKQRDNAEAFAIQAIGAGVFSSATITFGCVECTRAKSCNPRAL